MYTSDVTNLCILLWTYGHVSIQMCISLETRTSGPQDITKRHHEINASKLHQNCVHSKLRSKIVSVLGAHVLVKLDLFHAVQRISKTISKRHRLTQQCLTQQCMKRVFRSDGDSEEKRTVKRSDCVTLLFLM